MFAHAALKFEVEPVRYREASKRYEIQQSFIAILWESQDGLPDESSMTGWLLNAFDEGMPRNVANLPMV